MPTRRLVAAALVIAAGMIAGRAAPPASAHLKFADGKWTYKYFMRDSTSGCSTTTGLDPLNVIVYQYGEWSHMSDHLDPETHFGHTSLTYGHKYVCGCLETNHDSCTDSVQEAEEKAAHSSTGIVTRAHFRMFPAPHGHSAVVDKFTVLDVHHEELVWSGTQIINHKIDEPWQDWEEHAAWKDQYYNCETPLGNPSHNVWVDYYVFNGGQTVQGFFDNGKQSRIGGLHDDSYAAPPSGTC